MKTLIANWKMNPLTHHEAVMLMDRVGEIASSHPTVQTIICPPVVYLESLSALIRAKGYDVLLGAQDAAWGMAGPMTGSISPAMLKNFGVSHILVGHSERRAMGDTDEMTNKKLLAVLHAGMTPVLLVGEQEHSDAQSDFLIDQLTRGLAEVSADQLRDACYVYEPVWAISTTPDSRPATPRDAQDAIHAMRDIISKIAGTSLHGNDLRFLYGGSVNMKNVREFLAFPNIAGAVVGAASLNPEEFAHMIEITAKL